MPLCSQIVLSLTMPAVGAEEFFNEDSVIANLAALLGIEPSRIKVARIVAESKYLLALLCKLS